MSNALRINKFQGMILSLLLMSPWMFVYTWWTIESSYSLQLVLLMFFGWVFLYLRKIEAGTEAEVVFFEKSFKPNKHIWEDGFCLVPTLLPVLHIIGIHWLWDIRKNTNSTEMMFNPNVNIYHHKDQRIPEFKVNSDATLFQATVYRFIGNLTDWFFSIDSKDPELVYQKLGFRIIIVAFVLGWVGNFFPKNQSGFSLNNSNHNNATFTILVQLEKENPLPFFPENKSFEIDYTQNIQHYRDVGNTKLFAYHQVSGIKFPTIVVQEKLCAVVPAGKKISFISKTPPVYAANMVNEVYYFGKIDHLSFLRRNTIVFYYITGSMDHFQVVSDTWKEISDHWEKVDSTYHILAEAREKKEIPDGVAGGMVCF